LIHYGTYFIWFFNSIPITITSFGELHQICIGENSTPNSEFPRNAISGPLTLTLEPPSKVESLFLNGESLILLLNTIKFSVTRNYSKSYTVSILSGGYVYILENSPVLSSMLFCNPPYPYSLRKSIIEEDPSAGM
jgi:hypothetical protein